MLRENTPSKSLETIEKDWYDAPYFVERATSCVPTLFILNNVIERHVTTLVMRNEKLTRRQGQGTFEALRIGNRRNAQHICHVPVDYAHLGRGSL